MDKRNVLKIASKYVTAVKNKFNPIRVYLFGSYMKGNPVEESDIDIALVFEDYPGTIDMQLELMRLRRKIDSRIEPHPFRESEFNSSSPFVDEIKRTGVEIFNKDKARKSEVI